VIVVYDNDNIFARILRAEIPCHKIYEDEQTLAFMDIMPRAPGHTLVIPKARAVDILDISKADLRALIGTVHKLAPAVKSAMNADGLLIQQLNSPAAGQVVFHIHFHIVPRFDDVPLKHHTSEMEDDAVLAKNAQLIRQEL
jgi:histidine triad (HIT) family protein